MPQITGLVRDEPQPGQKHRANGKAILGEMGEERHSASLTLDKSRSHLNEYAGYSSGFECWDALVDDADAYKVKVNTKNGVRERKLPADAVIGWAMIANPPAEMTVGWDNATYSRFFDDTLDVMAAIVPDVFRRDNLRMLALHKDEGYMNDMGEYSWNLHAVGVPMGQNGRYCGNLIDAKRCVQICQDFPRMMRARGWDLDDLDLTDFERMGKDENGEYKDPAYRAERQAKRREQGRKTNKYIADKKAKAAELAAKATAELTEARTERDAAKAEAQAARKEAQAVKAEAKTALDAAKAATDEAARKVEEANKAYSDTFMAKFQLEREIGDMTEYRRWKAAQDAQEAQEKARKEREAQEARERQEAARKAQEAQEAAKRAQEAQAARDAEKRRQETGGLLSEDELMAEFRRRMGYKAEQPKAAPAPAPVQRQQQPEGGSALSRLRALAEQSAREQQQRTKDEGPSYPGS